MILSIKDGGYAFLIRLDLMFFYDIKRVLIITNFKLILHENYVKLIKFKRSPV